MNQPQAGTKIIYFAVSNRYNLEPTHPQAGTKTRTFIIFATTYQKNQPIPKRGRKSEVSEICVCHNNFPLNQPIPTRGRKSGKCLVFIIYAKSEPTHPHAGTKTLVCFFTERIIGEPPIPKRGRKSYISKSILSEFANQPNPTRGRKSLSIISV